MLSAWRPLPGWRVGATRYGLIRMSLLAFSIGVVAGLGAFVFRELIGLVHNVLFLGRFAFEYDANLFTPASPWGAGVILVPVVGAVIVTFLVVNFAPEARGHGVPEVMDAIYYGEGKIRPIVALVKSLASAFAIGSGASVGREGPIVQIGSSFGSTLGQLIRMDSGAADRPDRCRGRRRYRRDIQHANRRRPVRNRTDAPRGQRQHVSPRRSRDRDRDLHRADLFRDPPILSGAANRGPAAGAGMGGADHRAVHRAWRDRRRSRQQPIPAGSTHSRIGSTVFPTTICAIALAWPSSAF